MRLILLLLGLFGLLGLAACGNAFNPIRHTPTSCDATRYQAFLGQTHVPGEDDAYPAKWALVVPGGRLWPPDRRDDFYRFYLGADFQTIVRIDCAKGGSAIQMPNRDIPANGGRFGPVYTFGKGFE